MVPVEMELLTAMGMDHTGGHHQHRSYRDSCTAAGPQEFCQHVCEICTGKQRCGTSTDWSRETNRMQLVWAALRNFYMKGAHIMSRSKGVRDPDMDVCTTCAGLALATKPPYLLAHGQHASST